MNAKRMAKTAVGVLIKVVVIAVVILFVYKGASAAYDYGYRVFAEPAMAAEGSGRVISVAITEGKSVKTVGDILESKGLIRDSRLFYIQYLTSKFNEKDIVPGVYELNTEMVAEEILEVITAVPEVSEDDMDKPGPPEDTDDDDEENPEDTDDDAEPEDTDDAEDSEE